MMTDYHREEVLIAGMDVHALTKRGNNKEDSTKI
jgi:hypothetical protein